MRKLGRECSALNSWARSEWIQLSIFVFSVLLQVECTLLLTLLLAAVPLSRAVGQVEYSPTETWRRFVPPPLFPTFLQGNS